MTHVKHSPSPKVYAVLCGTLALLALTTIAPSVASAKQIRLFAGSFGAATSAPADPYPLSSGEFGPWSVAVDDVSGDVYVADQGNRRVEKFTAAGQFVLMFGKDVNKTKLEKVGSTEAERNVCTAASGDTCQPGVQASTPGAFDPTNTLDVHGRGKGYLQLAVDNSAGLSRGDVYVSDSSDNLISKFDSSGEVVASWGDNGPLGAANGQLNGSGASAPVAGPFSGVFEGIAVDRSGNLWAAQIVQGEQGHYFGSVFEFAQDSGFLTDWVPQEQAGSGGFNPPGIALDSEGDVYFVPEKFKPDGEWIGRVGSEGVGVAVDSSSDELYVDSRPQFPPQVIQRYASCHPSLNSDELCVPAESFGAGHLERATGIAIDPSGPTKTVYAAKPYGGEVVAFSIETVPDVTTVKASAFTASSATLNGIVNPAGVPLTECFFEWGEGSEPYANKVPCESPDAAGVGAGTVAVPVHAQVGGLSAGHTYHFRLVAANANTDLAGEPSRGVDFAFGSPLLESSYVTAVSSTAATLGAQAGPDGVETHLRFEYGTQAGVYGSTVEGDLGSATVLQGISRPIQGLSPNTVYHFRVVLENLFGTVEGEDRSFVTQGLAVPGLPDNRAWELVSPPDKNGTRLEGIAQEGSVIQAAADGSGLAYVAAGAIDARAAGNRSFAESQLLAHRDPGGWSTQDIATPHQAPVGLIPGSLSEYRIFSTDLSLGAVEPAGVTPLSAEAGEGTPYLRRPDGSYTPLVNPGNVPEGTKFGGKESRPEVFEGGVRFDAASPDLGHVLLSSPSVLTSPSFASGGGGRESVYQWAAGSLSLISQIPAGSAIVCGGAGPACGPAAAQKLGSAVGLNNIMVRHAVSTDGSRVVFVVLEAGRLFLRDSARGETLQLDAAEAGCGSCVGGGGVYQDASTDGSRVFFTDIHRLTADSTASQPDLYMCQIGEEAGHLACALKDLTVDHNPGESAAVQGDVIGAAADGSSVYFVANGALAEGAVHGNCTGTSKEPLVSCNLYRYDTATAATELIAVLSNRDGRDWAQPTQGNLALLTARVSPDGRWLAFMSQRPLTGYDNRDAVTGERDLEVFLYHASAEGGKGKLICASCNPTGARPHGVFSPDGHPPALLVDGPFLWGGQRIAANIPGWTPYSLGVALYQSRYLSNSGRLFFNAADALVAQDSNGTEDVYQYEPPGVGGCTESSPTFGQASGGCVGLISSGASGEESAFLDASESGDDVFFLTSAQLSHRDVDGALDVYDARVGGGEVEPVKPPSCEGDACQSPVQAPNDPTPGSLTFSGPGNLITPLAPLPKKTTKTVKCPKGKKLTHGKCVKTKSKKKAHRAKKATTNRRAAR